MTKDPKDKRGNSVDSRGEIEVRRPQRPQAPRLEMDGAAIPYDALIQDAPRGHANYLAQTLQQPLLLPRDMDSIQGTKQHDLFMSLKRDLAMVSCFSTIQVFKISFFFFLSVMLITFLIILVISMQVTQQVYVAEDQVQNANNKLNVEIQNRHDVEKALGMANHEKMQLAKKLKAIESMRQSAEARLKNTEAQAEDQCKELYTTQLNLATEQAAILDLKAKLQKAEEALKVAQEDAKATETSVYECEVLEMKARLTAERTVVCKEYCAKTYNQALDRAGIPTDSDLRRMDQVYYPKDLRENTTATPPPTTLPFPPPEQSLTTQEPSKGAKVPAGPEKKKNGAVVVSRTEEKVKENEKGKEKEKNKVDANPFEDALTIGDMVSKAKATESKSKINSKKEDSHQSQTQIQGFSFVFVIFVMALCF